MRTLFNRHINKGSALIILTWLLLLLPLCCGRTVIAMPSGSSVLDSLSTAIDSLSSLLDSLTSTHNPDSILYTDSIASGLAADSSDALSLTPDSLLEDSVSSKPVGGGLTDVVNFKAKDSLVFAAGNMAWLYGESEVTYTDINLTAERIQLSLDSSLVHANGVPDSTKAGKLLGKPVFKDKSGEYETRTMSYNFKTAKGYICDVTTQQGDGYVTGGTTKKMPDNDIFLESGRYTTCDQTECPHFYIELTKARVRPNKNIVTGPAYLVVSDVPLPVAIPFGYFPFTKSYTSGILMPSYGADQMKGLYLRDGGYYFAINDYVDLSLKGEIYTKGSWGISAESRYSMRYKFRGNFSFSYLVAKTGDKGMDDYSEQKNLRVLWSHSQDARFNPNLSLSASVNFTTSGYERSNTTSIYSNDLTTSTKSSSVSASYRIPNSNWSLSASANISQRTTDSTLVVSLPQLTASMTTWYPFKRKQKTGADKWYEKISMTYNMKMDNRVTAKQSEFFEKNIIRDWDNGISHSLPISATFTVAKYIQISPSFRFSDRTYSHKTIQYYDPTLPNSNGSYGGIAKDTVYGFYNAYDFSSSVSASTKLYGFYKPIWKNAKLFAVRHVLSPSLSFSYTPDFSQKKYGSWGTFNVPDSTSATGYRTESYNFFQGYSQGTTGSGRSGSISLTLSNNIEAKFRSSKDSTGYKKVSIIDNLNTNISYNMIAPSFRWSPTIPISATFKWGKNSTMNLSAQYDTYLYDEKGKKIDKPRWEVGKFPRLMSTGYSWSYSLNNQKLAQLFGQGGDDDEDEEDNSYDLDSEDGYIDEDLDPTSIQGLQMAAEKRKKKIKEKPTGKYDNDGYLIWSVPWTLNFSYTMRYGYKGFNEKIREFNRGIIHSATISGTLQPTKGWNFSFNASYDMNLNKVTFMNINASRDMHCWALTASLNPMGQFASFHVNVAVKAQMLSDLKYEKSSVSRSNKIDWYDD